MLPNRSPGGSLVVLTPYYLRGLLQEILVMDWDTKKNMLYNREDLLNGWFLVK